MVKVFENTEFVGKELETEIIAWEKEKSERVVVLKQMRDTQRYGVMNFLAEKPSHGLDDNVLFVCKENIEWRNSIIEQGHEESIKLLKELKELTNTMQKGMKCIDIELLKEDKQTLEDSSDMIQAFKDQVPQIQEAKFLTIEDFSKIA